ncbi:MAG: nucleoside triphosphate pyrophosphatase [Pseudomonadota bacterium]
MEPIVLASNSEVRANLLNNVRVPFAVVPSRVDEDAITSALIAENTKPRDIADALAEAKARKVSGKTPGPLVLGCDQVLDLEGQLLTKPEDSEDALRQLSAMQGKKHSLYTAAVLYEDNKPVWRHVGHVRLHMRKLSVNWLEEYVDRNWESIRHAVGCYKLEEEGARLFSRVDGDYFNVLGMPLLEILSYLELRGRLLS